MSCTLSEKALDWVAQASYAPVYRPVRIQKELETPMVKGILRGDFVNGDRIYADVENERLIFKRQAPELATV